MSELHVFGGSCHSLHHLTMNQRDTAEAFTGKELEFLEKRVNSWQRTLQYISTGLTQPAFLN